MTAQLSRLNRVELRNVWGHEAIDFTRWLALSENLDLLGREIEIELRLIETESNVGRFNLDILAEEETTGRKVIIENQLEFTDHDHLGKLITYASGFDAAAIVWIVKDIREEHKRAIEWLNERTDDTVGFFLLKIELWRIGDSDPAPKFETVVRPNEWAKAVKSSQVATAPTETKLKQLEFWTQFKDYVAGRNTSLNLRSPRAQHWYDVSIGSSEAHVALTLNSRESAIATELYIPDNKALFNYLRSKSEKIEKSLGQAAEWIDAAKASRIVVRNKVSAIFDPQEAVATNYSWLLDETLRFREIFAAEIRSFKTQHGEKLSSISQVVNNEET